MIRNATGADFDAMLDMGEQFYATTTYAEFAPYARDSAALLFDMMLREGVMLVAEDLEAGDLVGMVGLIVTPFHFNYGRLSAHEVMWWVDPGARGRVHGYSLLKAIEPACAAKGAELIQMLHLSSSPEVVGEMYKKLGYKHSESAYTKVI